MEWVGPQPWCDGAVGGMGISYFAMAQLAAAAEQAPHLEAIFPFATMDDLYDAMWHRGVLESGFYSSWLAAVAIMAEVPDRVWRGRAVDLARTVLHTPVVKRRLEHVNGESAAAVMRKVMRAHYKAEPFDRLWQESAVEHPTHDSWWDERNLRERLRHIDIPVYLGCQWDNVPVHLPSTCPVWEGLQHNPNVRMTVMAEDAMLWPWESLHEEALAWYDHWLKGRDTGIMDGPPIRLVIPGTDEWYATDSWPPPETRHVAYQLAADGTLDPAGGEAGSRSYLHLPADSGRARNAPPRRCRTG